MLEYRLLGPLEVATEHGAVALGGPRQRATLAILLLNANRVVSVDRLADGLYAGTPPVTAVAQVQRQISELRKVLGDASAIETVAPGYAIRLEPGQLDLALFEQRCEEADAALAHGDAERAASSLAQAFELWRGPPLADLAYESFAQTEIERLEELRLTALEQRLDAELACGRHARIAGELEQLAARHPLRERFRAQLMVALYRSGRQAEALEAYRATRLQLVGELGIEPGRELQELERAILAHDPALELQARASARGERERCVLVLPSDHQQLDPLVAVAEELARLPHAELVIARLVQSESEVAQAASALHSRRLTLSVEARTAAFTADDRAGDAVRMATAYDVDVVLTDHPLGLGEEAHPDELTRLFDRSPADVAVLAGSAELGTGKGVYVPFGGGEHDWSALELAAWFSVAGGMPLRLVGTKAYAAGGDRDASRLLADASLAVQRLAGVRAEPVLVDLTEDALLQAVRPARLVVVGVSPRWRREGLGVMRAALVREAAAPTLLVHRGPRPSGMAPRESRSRFTWTLEARYSHGVSSAAT